MNTKQKDIATPNDLSKVTAGGRSDLSSAEKKKICSSSSDNSTATNEDLHYEFKVSAIRSSSRNYDEAIIPRCNDQSKQFCKDAAIKTARHNSGSYNMPQKAKLVTPFNKCSSDSLSSINNSIEPVDWDSVVDGVYSDKSLTARVSEDNDECLTKLKSNVVSTLDRRKQHRSFNFADSKANAFNDCDQTEPNTFKLKKKDLKKDLSGEYSSACSNSKTKFKNRKHLPEAKHNQTFSRKRVEREKQRLKLNNQVSDLSSLEDLSSVDSLEFFEALPMEKENVLKSNDDIHSTKTVNADRQVIQGGTSSESLTQELEDPWIRPSVTLESPTLVCNDEISKSENSNYTSTSTRRSNMNDVEKPQASKEPTVANPGHSESNNEAELERIDDDGVDHRANVRGRISPEAKIEDRMRNDLELLTRPSWCDARFALSRVMQGKAKGNIYALKLRRFLHGILFQFGCSIQKNAKIVLFLGVLILAASAVGLQHAHMETNIENLWVEAGGTLSEELAYTKRALSPGEDSASTTASSGYSIQMMIHTGENVLTTKSLMLHLKAAIAATKVTVAMYNQTWGFSDVCYKETLPIDSESENFITPILEKLFPCFIISPLDCFWEGSKLLGPTPPIYLSRTMPDITWTKLHPINFIDKFIESITSSSLLRDTLIYYKDLMIQAGITSGYQERWCLDPHDPECPETAPNYESKELPDINALIAEGCSGFASKLMQWPVDLIVGAIERDNTENFTRAQGLQTLFNLMGAQNMYEFHKGIKTGHDWTVERAQEILSNWQRSFVEAIYMMGDDRNATNNNDTLYAFSVATAEDILTEFSNISYFRVVGGYLLMMGYACLSLMRWRASRSQGAVGVIGVLLVALSVAAGLGICSVLGISFNAASTQVLPFLLLGLGVDDMFLMAHHFGEISVLNYIPFEERTGECLKRVGVSVFLTSIAILSGFLLSLIIPMPALRAFGLQASIVTVFNLLSVLVVFPAILSIDLVRRKNNQLDIFCCFDSSTVNDVVDLTEQNTRQNGTCGHVLYHSSPISVAPVHNSAALPGTSGVLYGEPGEATTITMHHTIQAYSNDSYVTVLGPSTGASVSCASTPQNGTKPSSPVPPYAPHPNTPPPEYTAKVSKKDNGDAKPSQHRPRVAFVNQAISEPSTTGRSTPATTGVAGRISRRGNGSNPPTNLTTPMESVRSSTHSLVPHRRRGRRSGFFRRIFGSIYACLATIPSLTISQLGERYYAPFLLKNSVRVTVIVLFLGLLGISAYGATLIEDGLDFGDVLPRGTREHSAIVAQTTYFSFYNMYIVTKSFDYASNQRNLDKLHNSMESISYVMRNTDGTLTKYWLDHMRDWLQDLQDEFDRAWANGEVNETTWTPQASDKTVLAFKLLLQTGKADDPVEAGNIGCRTYVEGKPCEKVDRLRLVSDDGLIPEAPFYNYLSAWVGNDPLAYASSQAQIRPEPTAWSFTRDLNMIIPRSPAIYYAQMPFYLNNMRENQDFVNVINWVRGSIEAIEAQSQLSAYPSGYPFTFWQQYIDLRFWLFIALACVIVAVFLVLSIVLFNPWAAAIMAVFLAMIATELLGFMGATNVKLSAVPAVILVASIGLGVEFTVHITFAYITSCGSRKERVKHGIGHMLGPVIDGSISTLLGVVMLAGAEFDFIITYFFQVLAALIFLGVLNGLVLLPVVLSLIGPPPEVIPIGGGSRLKTPTPPSTPPGELSCGCSVHQHTCERHNANSSNNINHLSQGFYCYQRRPAAPCHQHHPNCTGSHYLSPDDIRACHHHQSCRVNGYRREPTSNPLWRHRAGNHMSQHNHEGYPPHAPHCHRHSRREEAVQRGENNMAWQQHPFAVPPSRRTEDLGRVFVYPHAEYVVYSTGATPPNEFSQDNHCEAENFKASEGSQGERPGVNLRNSQVPTLTATSSLTVQVHPRRQPVVAFVEPASNSTARTPPNGHSTDFVLHPDVEQQTQPQQSRFSRRRFDISALSQPEALDDSLHPNALLS